MYNIVVVGAGIVGVSTAVNIQKKLPSARVRIIADKFDQDTTSWGAGGLFRPTTKYIEGIEVNRLRYDIVPQVPFVYTLTKTIHQQDGRPSLWFAAAIFDLPSAFAEQLLTTLDRKQVLNIFYHVCDCLAD